MSIRNTSRQSGGVGIKLKVDSRIKWLVITVLGIVGGYFFCIGAYMLFDKAMNGFLVDWFENHYVRTEWHALDGLGQGYYDKTILWWKVKASLLQALILLVTLWILTVRIASIMYATRQEKRIIQEIRQLIADYMRHDRESTEGFPDKYAAVSGQMAEIKAATRRHEQTLKEETTRKNDLITYLAHDLKTPLTSVIGYLNLLEEAPDMPEAQKAKYVHIVLDKAQRLESLINEFFEITRYNLQQIILEKEIVHLPFMLVQMADEFYPVLNAHGNTVKLELPSGQGGTDAGDKAYASADDITVYADAEKLARVFQNILKNAIAYSYPNTEIRIGCREMGNRVSVTFSNKGRTIPRQKLDSIFEKFFRLDEARATNTGGSGLGLAIARDIVSLHGGTVTAQSQDEETTFAVELPS